MTIEKVWLSGQKKDQYLCSASIIIADGSMRFCVRGLRIIDIGREEPSLAMPSIKKTDRNGHSTFDDIFYPMNQSARDFLHRDIFHHYGQACHQR